jgi:Fic family protein
MKLRYAIQDKLNEIDRLRKEWKSLQPLKKEDVDRLWKKLRLDWNYNSNHIEGNTLTYGETELLLIFGQTTGDHSIREYEEMKAHDVAIDMVRKWARNKSRQLSEADIRDLNKIILKEPYWKEAESRDGQRTRKLIKIGEYKDQPNSVRLVTGEMFEYAKPEDTQRLMGELMEWYRKNSRLLHPVVLAAEFHYQFIRIHPFDDGNGRVARLIASYVLLRRDMLPVIIKSADKANYIAALRKADVGDIYAFHSYIADQVIWSLELGIRAAKGENIEEPDDIDKEIAVWKKQFASKTADVMPKSDEQIYELYFKGFRQMFLDFIEKMRQFDDLFAITRYTGFVNSTGRGEGSGLHYIDEAMQKFGDEARIEEEFKTPVIRTSESFQSISLDVQFSGFKKDGLNAFYRSCSLRIDFQSFSYKISVDGDVQVEKMYSQFLDTETSKKIVAYAVKSTFEGIKKNIKGK